MVLALWLGTVALPARAAQAKASFVYVDKSERAMFVFAGRELLLHHRVALGRSPVGHKQQEGDKRTPEGQYLLDWKNPNSRYYRSIHVFYPDTEIARARATRGYRRAVTS